MPKRRNPILRRAWDLIVLSISTPMYRLRKPITGKLLVLFKRPNKRFHLLNNYNHYYEFSPSSTPLFFAKRVKRNKKRRILSLLLCGRNDNGESTTEWGMGDEVEVLSMVGDESEVLDMEEEEEEEAEEEDDVSVNGRAEKFIQRFYEEMRIQRCRSL